MLPEHAVVRPLLRSDVDKAVELETLAFTNPAERASKAKIQYRLSVCSELSLGVFLRNHEAENNKSDSENPTFLKINSCDIYAAAYPSEIDREEKLIAHIIATQSDKDTITNESMEIPDLVDGRPVKNDSRGHINGGTSIAIHSLAVHPDYQSAHIGSSLLNDYTKRMSMHSVVDKVILIAHPEVAPFYVKNGFADCGTSSCDHAGETWVDLVYRIDDSDDSD
ncbi:hypothetical protein CANCADRAFT_26186 [Tortispora caseinolytica NRRL Y-17796]|uniref:N-acetyltransferase domain-containing protein n=1 Tax=Tortispora caseinolytica NRRL Y-17796 TaxID=767744 RepID=A0A1E4TE34_9ASCO|nr:hypothetical protein CANCADRAFT_26186 [Tortispora caseinolytica NRRL Y-17796]